MKFSTLTILVVLAFGLGVSSCKKSNSVSANGDLYPVTAKVLNPAGEPQGGAILKLSGKDDSDPVFATVTDDSGNGTIQAPAGQQTLIAKMGSIFQTSFTVNVLANSSGTSAGSVTLKQNTQMKVLVIYGGCEQIETVLSDPSIGFTKFDTTDVDYMRNRVQTDSNATLNYLKNYTLVFSDCNCGDEDGYPLLARTYGRYVAQGGKIYGGHYNYMNLQYIFPPYYSQELSTDGDSVTVVDDTLSKYVGFKVAAWTASTSLGYYEQFSDLPPSAKVYVVITGTQPATPVIVLNTLQSGKYLYTIYHNQDILSYTGGTADPRLIKIVKYFLYSL
ncbi:MAG TPA: hypothetical protein VIS48_07235 [Candidatus Kryptonia bacterium]